jgi:hypothetical protein
LDVLNKIEISELCNEFKCLGQLWPRKVNLFLNDAKMKRKRN